MFPAGDEVMEALDRSLALLGAEDRQGWSSPARSARLLALLERVDRMQATLVRLTGEWDGDRSWEADGALSAPSWLAAHSTTSKRDARRLVHSARLAHRHDVVGRALAAGALSPAHVDVLARATKGRTSLLARDVETLVDVASTVSVDDFATAMAHWRSLADDEMAREDAQLAFHERSVTWVTTLDGRVEFRVSLDAEGGATVVEALEAYDRPDPAPEAGGPADGPRTVAQRHADGLVQLCSEALHQRARAGHPVAGVDAVVDVERLGFAVGTGAVGECSTTTGAGPGELADWLRSRCELRGIGPVARDVLLRVACDAAVGRVVLRGKSEILDVGRRTRVVNRALRRAIELRDRGCAFPGCDAPLHWCDVHHLVHWAHGGETSLDNCLLLCRRHHVLCHEGGWELGRGPDGSRVVVARGRPPRARRRGPPGRLSLAA